MLRAYLVILFCLIAIEANGASGPGATMGAGTFSCAEFAKQYQKSPEHIDTTFFYWAQGYMSGMNVILVALKKPIHDLNAEPINAQQQTIRAFCNERPLATFLEAVQNLYEKLPLANSN
jgi:hypothetical protein